MQATELQFLKDLLHTPSPSGYEQAIQKVVRGFAEPFSDQVRTDWHGNVMAAVNPNGFPRIMLAGHCDQIGLMVKHVDDSGFLWCEPIGGWDVQMLIGQNMVVWGKDGPVPGVIARKAIHLLTPEERKQVPEIKDLWIDIGAANRDEALTCVAVGDCVTFELGFRELRNQFAAAPGMDNKVGTWVVMNALRQVAAGNPKAAVFAVSTVQEEIGLRGAITSSFSIDPHLGIAVDVTHATDCPTLDKKQHGDIKLGQGPAVVRGPNVNPVVHSQLKAIAADKKIPIQIAGLSKPAGNDANAMQISRGGQATGIVGIPNRYMHSPVEVISLTDLENAAKLIAEFCLSLNSDSDFTPV
ncbi:MAG: peptidase family protein [Planctomycetaceae bacterium]|nr:peptidase family protein [Planctomycetaceae bacterium]